MQRTLHAEKLARVVASVYFLYDRLRTILAITPKIEEAKDDGRAPNGNIMENPVEKIKPFDPKGGELNVIVDTPKGSRNKYIYDETFGIYKLGGVLTAGHSFPYDFGFIPNTLGGDGDPLDVLVMMDEPAFVGCLLKCRLIGGIKAEQKELGGQVERNDRLLAVACKSIVFEEMRSIRDINKTLVDQIEHFFISYNQAKGKEFRPLGRFGAKQAVALVKKSTTP